MKKLSKKQIITISVTIVVIIALIVAGIMYGTKGDRNNKEADKKTEFVKKEDKTEVKKEDLAAENEEVETETESNPEEEQQSGNSVVEEPKQENQQQASTNTNQNQNNQNTNNSGNINTPSNNSTTNNNTSNNNQGNSGNNTNVPSTGGMYSKLDSASKERFSKCAEIFGGGLAGAYMTYNPTTILYFNENIQMTNDTTNGSWMYISINGWSTNGGSAETAPAYDELPVLMKQCFETIAPQGGTELYNRVNSLILQYGGPRNVPTQGRITESIPGLYVTLEKGYSGLEVFFWAE